MSKHLVRKFLILRSFKKVKLNSLVETEHHGSPVVYINPDTNESSVIGVHVGDTDQKGWDVVITWHGILKMLQGLVCTNIAMDIGLSGFHLWGGGGELGLGLRDKLHH